MDVGKHTGKLFNPPDALGSAGSEDLRKGVDPGRADADVVHAHARVAGLLDRVRRVRPGITALIAFVRYQAVADDDQQAPLRRLSQKPAGQMAKGGTESGVSACG